MRMRTAAVVLLLFFTSFVAYEAFAAGGTGTKCPKVGQTTTVNGEKLTCSLIWVANKPKTSATPTPPASNSLQSKSFRLESVSFNNDLGGGGAEARVKNTSKYKKTAVMTITIFKSDGKTIALTLNGSANEVAPGETVTVSFFSIGGDLPSEQFKYAFQVTAEF